MKTKIQTPKGFRDFYPENWQLQKWLSKKWLSLGTSYGYQEYEAPILEPIELYLEKTSQEIIEKQTFIVKDRGGKTLVLRPELTPSLARMLVEKENTLTFPYRLQSYGRFWRYEKPQKGRGREFFQWNIDILGTNSPESDAEILTIAINSLKALNISNNQAKLKINDKNFLVTLLSQKLAISLDKANQLLPIIDKFDKLSSQELDGWLSDFGLSTIKTQLLKDILNNQVSSISPKLKQIINLIPKQLQNYIEIDLKIVRGFLYYTDLVFEAWANTNLKRSLFGGGRYNNLTLQIGGKKQIGGVGFAIGDMPIIELLKETNQLPNTFLPPASVLIAVFSSAEYLNSLSIAQKLRKNNINTQIYPDPSVKLPKQLKYASDTKIPFVLVIGPDEVKNNTITLKNMITGTQQILKPEDLLAQLS